MVRSASFSTCSALAAALFVVVDDAHALGPVDVEIAAKAGYATSPLSEPGISNPPNPLGFGVGGRAGIVLKGGLYLGASVVDYVSGSANQTTATTRMGITSSTVSTHVLMYGAEMGYGVKLLDP